MIRSRHPVLRGGSSLGVRDTWQRSDPEVHDTELRGRVRLGGHVGGQRRDQLQNVP